MAATGRIDELKKRYDENPRRFFAPLANEYRKSGDLELAITLCRQHLADAPQNLSGQIVFGQALFDAGTLDESRVAFETAIGLDPENLIALRHLGDIARAQTDVPRARDWYQRVLDADRRNEEVLAIMAELATMEAAAAAAGAAAASPEPAQELLVEPTSLVDEVAAPSAPALALEPAFVEPLATEPPHAEAPPPEPPAAEPSTAEPSPPVWAAPPQSEIKTVEIPALRRPVPTPVPEPVRELVLEPLPEAVPEPAAEPFAPEPAAVPEPFAAAVPEAVVDEHSTMEGLDFGAFSTELPTAEAAMSPPDTTPDFGQVDLPDDSPFGGSADMAQPSPFGEAIEELPNAMGLEFDAPAVEDAAPPPPPAPLFDPPIPERAQDLGAFEMASAAPPTMDPDAGTPPRRPSAPALDAFELEESAPAMPAAAAPEPAYEPEPPRSEMFEMFDPVRSMPTPIAPVTPIGSSTPIESAAPVDLPVDLPPVALLVEEPPPPATPVFATETMAELYVSQGLRPEAIAVYHELIAARPDDAGLRARLAELEGMDGSPAAHTARTFFANLAGRRATPRAAVPVIEEVAAPVEPSAYTEPAYDAAASDAPAVDAVAVDAVAVDAVAVDAVAVDAVAVDAVAVDAVAVDAVAVDAPAVDAGSVDASAAYAAAVDGPAVATPGGTLDALFGHSDVETPDNSAAQSLASAFGSAPVEVPGRPTRAAADEFSLDRLFRGPASTPSQGGLAVPRQSTALRFDQFFAGGSAEPAAPSPDAAPPADPGGDSEQFQSWLSGLKKQ